MGQREKPDPGQHLPLSLIAQGWGGDEAEHDNPDKVLVDHYSLKRRGDDEPPAMLVTVGGELNAEARDRLAKAVDEATDRAMGGKPVVLEAIRSAHDRGLITPAQARDAFVSMVEATRAQNTELASASDTATPKPAPRTRRSSPARDRFERKYGPRPLPENQADRPRRRWLWRTLYVAATLVTLAASVATLWHMYGG
jgi:hypothetical protein